MPESLTPLTDEQIDDAHNIALYDDCKGKDGLYRGKKIEVEIVPASFARSLELRLNATLAENEELRKDKERLDWLNDCHVEVSHFPNEGNKSEFEGLLYSPIMSSSMSIRDSLDSAIQSTNKPNLNQK